MLPAAHCLPITFKPSMFVSLPVRRQVVGTIVLVRERSSAYASVVADRPFVVETLEGRTEGIGN